MSLKTKLCSFGCNTVLYWNLEQNKYYELNTRKIHICPNRKNAPAATTTTKPKESSYTYNNNKTWTKTKEEKVPMSNSIEIIQGEPREIRMKYEYLSDLINTAKGRTHGSQSHIVGGKLAVIVYYEVPEGWRGNLQESMKQFKEKYPSL